jgi:hypothetical protein
MPADRQVLLDAFLGGCRQLSRVVNGQRFGAEVRPGPLPPPGLARQLPQRAGHAVRVIVHRAPLVSSPSGRSAKSTAKRFWAWCR